MHKPESCKGCILYDKGISFSEPDGSGIIPIVFVGESLGDIEAREGKPFQEKAPAGSKLKQCFVLAEGELGEPVRRNQFKFWNLVACQPPYNLLDGMYYEQDVIEHCRKAHFNRVIDEVATKEERVIVALGNLPLKYLTGASGQASEKQSISHLQGYVLKGKYGLTIGGWHPSYLKRGKPQYTPMLVEVIKRAIAVSRGEYVHRWHKDYKKPVYNVFPGYDDAWSFYYTVKDNLRRLLTFDIETQDSAATDEDERDEVSKDIIQIQFSLGKGQGVAFPYTGEYIKIVDALLQLENIKANHNTWNFDNPILRAKGHLFKGFVHDTMWMFKHYQPGLPRNLQNVAMMAGFPFPWKHLFTTNLGEYGCADVDAVQWIVPWLVSTMKRLEIWHGYRDQVAGLYCPTLMRASEIGIPVNEDKRLELYNKDEDGNATGEFEEIRKKIDDELQGLIPDELKNLHPSKRVKDEQGNLIGIDWGYKREPKEIGQLKLNYDIAVKALDEQGRKPKVSFEQLAKRKLQLECRDYYPLDGSDSEARWVKIKDFKPSFEQVVRYIKWKRESLANSSVEEDRKLAEYYVVPKMPKIDKVTGERTDKDTTGRKVLEDLFYETGDRVLEAVLELRSVQTTISNYIPNWKPKSDGAVHTTWKFPAASNQLSTSGPSILNCSKHTENGQRFRRIVEAPPGYTFAEFDKKSYHVASMAFLAKSRNYMRFSQIDPHSILTSRIMPREWGKPVDMTMNDDEIREYCSYIKKKCKGYEVDIRQKVAKPAVLGNQLLLGPRKLHLQNRRFIVSVKHAIELQAAIKDMFPEVTETQDEILETANAKHRLHIPEFGKNQWFYDVFNWKYSRRKSIWERKKSTDAEKAVAFLVQGYAFGELHWDILAAEELGYNERWNFINTIHDSVIYMIRDNELEEAVYTLYNLYSRPCHLMVNDSTGPEGFRVGVEVAIGKNWQSMDYFGKGTNPQGFREIGGKEMWERFGIAA